MKNDVVILIDCWAGHQGSLDLRTPMCRNIIESTKEIDPGLVVMATYDSNEIFDSHLRHNNRWISTFWKYFGPHWRGNQNSRQKTHDLILNSDFSCEQVALTHLWQLEHMINQIHIPIQRVWFFGLHWNACIRDSGVGWSNVKNHWGLNKGQNLDILFKDNCTLKNAYETDSEPEIWPDIGEDSIIVCQDLGQHTWKLKNEYHA
jgi:hypothetical protein